VPQGDLLFGDLTVGEHLIIPLRRQRRRERMARIEGLYEIFPQLGERRSQYARSLSGGEKRMLAIARSLLLGAHTLLIDEPSLGLSPLMVDNVYRQIKELSAAGITILIVEENPARLRGLASDLYLLDRGAVAAHLPTEALLEDSSLLTTYLGATFEAAGAS
jgi:branched-chain amino acid transport system ATP-binding protein